MSREQIVGTEYTIAFGVDHVTGAFVQLWVNPAHEQDGALIRVDSDGVHPDYATAQSFDPALRNFLAKFWVPQRFMDIKPNDPNTRLNIGEQDVIELARVVGGFPDIAMDVYRIFGDDI